MTKKILFGKPIVGKNELKTVKKVLESGIYVHGPKTSEFEENFKNFTKAKHAISVSSCTSGMHLVYFSLGIGPGDEVIVPAQTHVATAHAVEYTGAKPIFVDCEITTGNIDIIKIEKAITKKTKAITVVHYLGLPVDMVKIQKIAKRHKLFVLEDCALSLGAKVGNKHTGLCGNAGVFSFYPVKHMTTAEGGMVITNDKNLAKKIRIKKAFGINKNFGERKIPGIYDAVELGFNYRMNEIEAAIGVEQLKKIPAFLKKRKENFKILLKLLKKFNKVKILTCLINKNLKSSHYCLSLVLDPSIAKYRNNIVEKLKKMGIGSSIYYPQPVPRMTYYKRKYGYKKNHYANASKISDQSIALPVGPHLNKSDMNAIANGIVKAIKTYLR